jgi:hypothetical protein
MVLMRRTDWLATQTRKKKNFFFGGGGAVILPQYAPRWLKATSSAKWLKATGPPQEL